MDQNKKNAQKNAALEQNKKNAQKAEDAKSLLEQYKAQTEENENIHFEHYDWTYNDSSCCC